MLPLRSLKPAKRNARTHSKRQVRQIADSMLRFGVINPLVVDEHNQLVAGHGRAEAAKLLGLKTVPAIRVPHLTEAEVRAYALADNKLADNAGWDRALLAVELGELHLELPNIGLDLGITGFDPGEVDAILGDFQEGKDPADEVPQISGPPVSRATSLSSVGIA